MSEGNNSLADLGTTAERILAAFVVALEAQGVDVPGVRFVSPGADLAWDGEQLSVNLLGIDQGGAGVPEGVTMYPTATRFAAQFSVMLIREVPALSEDSRLENMLPSPQEAQAAAERTINDAGGMALASVAVHAQYLVSGPGEDFVVGPVAPFGPQDGLVGTRCLVTLAVN